MDKQIQLLIYKDDVKLGWRRTTRPENISPDYDTTEISDELLVDFDFLVIKNGKITVDAKAKADAAAEVEQLKVIEAKLDTNQPVTNEDLVFYIKKKDKNK